MSKVAIKTAPLKNFADYSSLRVSAATLSADTFVGVDNLLQNKLGKTRAEYVPTTGNVTKYSKGDTLIGNIRPYLKKIWHASNSGGSSADVLTIHPKEGVDPRYIFYNLFQDNFFEFVMAAPKGTRMPRGDKNRVLDYPIPNFELEVQQKIVSVFSALDNKIEFNNKINAELEQMEKTLYDYWFVQFDFPDANGNPYKSSGGAMVYNEALKREIPKDWEVKKLNEKIKIGSGYPFVSTEYIKTGEFGVVTIKNVQDGELDTGNIDKVNLIPKNMPAHCHLEKGDVLMSLTGNVGRLCIVDQDNLLLNQRVGKLISVPGYEYYGHLFFLRPENRLRLEQIAGGSSQANLSPIDAVKCLFVDPEEQVLNYFNQSVGFYYKLLVEKKIENQKLAELRDWLLPMLMKGQVVVK